MLARLISLTIVTVENRNSRVYLYLVSISSTQRMQAYAKKALILSAFFIAYFLLIPSALAENCSSSKLSPAEKATVKWVYDGDTLLLNDKRKIRIIGIDTPEVKHHKQKAQAYGAKAREALRELLNRFNYRVLLRYSVEKKDRYSRQLAHVYLPDGTNLSNWLLERGYAKTMPFPPNIRLAKCYQRAEYMAQQKSLRIWRYDNNNNNQIKTAKTLPQKASGSIRFQGVIKKIKHHKKSSVLIFKDHFKGHSKKTIRIKIKNKNLKYFKKRKLSAFKGKTIIVSGTLRNRKGKRTIYINHPTQLKVL